MDKTFHRYHSEQVYLQQQGFPRVLLRGFRGSRAERFLVILAYNVRKLIFTFRKGVEKPWPERSAA